MLAVRDLNVYIEASHILCDVGLEVGTYVGDHAKRPYPPVLPCRVVEQDEPSPADLQASRLDRGCERHSLRCQPPGRRLVIDGEFRPGAARGRQPKREFRDCRAELRAAWSLVPCHDGGPRHGRLRPRGRAG